MDPQARARIGGLGATGGVYAEKFFSPIAERRVGNGGRRFANR